MTIAVEIYQFNRMAMTIAVEILYAFETLLGRNVFGAHDKWLC